MNRAPHLIALTLVVGASLWALALAAAEDEPFAADAAVLVSVGLLMFGLIAAVGLLVPRGRWARNVARGLLAAELGLAVVTPLRGWALAALAAIALGIVGVQGRWLDGWLRRLPSAEGPGVKPIMYMLGSLALVPLSGIASPDGLMIRQGLLGAAGFLIAWGYSRAKLWGLWAGRLLYVPLAITFALLSPLPGAVLIVVAGFALSWLAWTAEVRLAVSPLLDELPGPRRLAPRRDSGE